MVASEQSHARIQALTATFEQIHQAVIATVERCSPAAWQAICPTEERSVAVVAHHIAVGYAAELEGLRAAMAGQAMPPIYQDRATLNQFNAEHALQQASCTREEVLDLLRHNGAAVADFIRGLRDDDLPRVAPLPLVGGPPWTVQQWVERLLIGHAQHHLQSIQAVTGAE